MECAPEIWLSAPSILDTCPLSLSAPGLKRSSQAQSIRWLVGSLVHHGHSETGEKTDACWVTTTTLLLGTVGSRRPPSQLRSAEDYHNGSPSNGTSLATMRLQTQGNCPSWGVCFPPPTHPRVPCTRFKIGKPLSRLSASGTHCASPAVFWCWARFHPPCMPFASNHDGVQLVPAAILVVLVDGRLKEEPRSGPGPSWGNLGVCSCPSFSARTSASVCVSGTDFLLGAGLGHVAALLVPCDVMLPAFALRQVCTRAAVSVWSGLVHLVPGLHCPSPIDSGGDRWVWARHH